MQTAEIRVIPARLERATHSLEGCCSIQLSYGTDKAAKIAIFIYFVHLCGAIPDSGKK